MQGFWEFIRPTKIKLIYAGIWAFYLLFELILGTIDRLSDIKAMLGPALLFYLVASLLVWAANRWDGLGSFRRLLSFSVLLLALDQILKILIYNFLPPTKSISVVSGVFRLQQVRNHYSSWIFSKFDLEVNTLWLTGLAVIVMFFIIIFYRYYRHTERQSVWVDVAFSLVVAGVAAAIIDQLLWGFTVDFLQMPGFYTADFKDIYLTVGFATFFGEMLDNPETDWDSSLKDLWISVKEMFKFTLGELRN